MTKLSLQNLYTISVANCNFVNSQVGSQNIPRFPKKSRSLSMVINPCFVMVTTATVMAVRGDCKIVKRTLTLNQPCTQSIV